MKNNLNSRWRAHSFCRTQMTFPFHCRCSTHWLLTGAIVELEKRSAAPPPLLALPTDWVLGDILGVCVSAPLWASSWMGSIISIIKPLHTLTLLWKQNQIQPLKTFIFLGASIFEWQIHRRGSWDCGFIVIPCAARCCGPAAKHRQCVSLYCRTNAPGHSTSPTDLWTIASECFSPTKAETISLWTSTMTSWFHWRQYGWCSIGCVTRCLWLTLCCCSLLSSVLSSTRLREIPVLEREDTALDKLLDL